MYFKAQKCSATPYVLSEFSEGVESGSKIR